MDSLFYDDQQYNSSLLHSPKKDRSMASSGKGHSLIKESKQNGNGNSSKRSILKNSNDIKCSGSYYTPAIVNYQCNELDEKGSYFNRIIRPCAAEFVAVFLSIFIGKVMEEELVLHITTSNTERIILQAFTDSVVVLAMLMAFQTVHLNPVITLAEFFALTTAWPMCCAMVIAQMVASVTAIASFAMIRLDNLELQMPTVHNIAMDRVGIMYHLILSQFIGTLLVIVTHLLVTGRTGSGLTALARPKESPLSVVAAVFVSSLLCLLNSTVGWNPLLAFALASYGSIDCNFGPLQMQGVFWIGPCLASLSACFLYRLLFAGKEFRLIKCTTWNESDHL